MCRPSARASHAARARAEVEAFPLALRAALLTLLALVNVERAQHGRPPVTPAQFVAAARARVDELEACGVAAR